MYCNTITMFGAYGYYSDSAVTVDIPADPADATREVNETIEPSKAANDGYYNENGAYVKSK